MTASTSPTISGAAVPITTQIALLPRAWRTSGSVAIAVKLLRPTKGACTVVPFQDVSEK